jgi:hypothetical protein
MNVSVAFRSALSVQKGWARRWAMVWIRSSLILVALLVLARASDPRSLPADVFRRRLREETRGSRFDFATWEWEAVVAKIGLELAAPQDTLTEAQRRQLVTEYLDTLGRVNVLRDEIQAVYSQSEGQEAAQRAAVLEGELERLRVRLAERQGLVEGILEEQVSAELQAEGLGQWGYVWPPVKIRFTELPLLLVVSSRAEITREVDVDLKTGMPLSEQEAIEDRVDGISDKNVSLVTPIGGLSAYPAMILEHDSLIWLADTFAHEWMHHWLIFRPLGMNYSESGEMTSINETVASIVGREIGRRMILSFYGGLAGRLPELPVPPAQPPFTGGELVWPEDLPPDRFDYSREMRQTRLRVDELLADGKVGEAEAYMEERRQVFVEQGYSLRKLNQAYFAFYGSYATSPSAGNPIGGQLEWLRGQSLRLRDFVSDVASIARYQDLLDRLPKE